MTARKRKLTQKALELEEEKEKKLKSKTKSPVAKIAKAIKDVITKQTKTKIGKPETTKSTTESKTRSSTGSRDAGEIINSETKSRSKNTKSAQKSNEAKKVVNTRDKSRSTSQSKVKTSTEKASDELNSRTRSKSTNTKNKTESIDKTVPEHKTRSRNTTSKKNETKKEESKKEIDGPKSRTKSVSNKKETKSKPTRKTKSAVDDKKETAKINTKSKVNAVESDVVKEVENAPKAESKNVDKVEAVVKTNTRTRSTRGTNTSTGQKDTVTEITKGTSEEAVNAKSTKPIAKTRSTRAVKTATITLSAAIESDSPQDLTIIGARRKRKLEPSTSVSSIVSEPAKKPRRQPCRAEIEIPSTLPSNDLTATKRKNNRKSIAANKKVTNATPTETEKVEQVDEKSSSNKNKTPKKIISDVILNLLSDKEDEPEEIAKPAKRKSLAKTAKPAETKKKRSLGARPSMSKPSEVSQLEVSRNTSQIPIWKRLEIKDTDEFTGGDIYDPKSYLDIDGDDTINETTKKKKKPTRRKKKDTKALLTFGEKNRSICKAVKGAYNLKTPLSKTSVARRNGNVSKTFSALKSGYVRGGGVAKGSYVSNNRGDKNVSNVPLVSVSFTDVSCGAQNFFDTFQDDPSIQATSNNLTATYNKRKEAPTNRQPAVPAKSKVVAEPVFDDATADYNDDHMDHMDIDEPPPIPVPVIKEPESAANVTPTFPKTFAKRLQIQKDHSSTPKMDSGNGKDLSAAPAGGTSETIKDMIQNAFGFDSEESEEDDYSCCGESIISPVKKVPTSFLEVSKPYDSRMSTISFREPAEPVRTNMWRADVERAVPQYQTDMKRQIMALERERVEQGLAKLKQKRFSKPSLLSSSSLHSVSSSNGTRTSPRKLSTFRRPDMLSSTTMASVQEVSTPDMEVSVFDMPAADGNNADFELTVPAKAASNRLPESPSKSGSTTRQSPLKALSSRNAYDVLKSAASSQTTGEQKKPLTKVKKLTKKLPKRQELDQTSFLEDSVATKINSGGLTRKKLTDKKVNSVASTRPSSSSTTVSDKENSSSNQSKASQAVRTYSANTSMKPLNASKSVLPTRKPVKRKKVDAWASMQTSAFSEIEDFEMSFV